jgi:Ca2+-binding EF-hand superfamily protein
MTSISSLGSSMWSSISALQQRQPQKLSEKLQDSFDTDGSGGLNTDELQSMMDEMSSRTGQASGSSAQDLLANNDANGDGNLSTDELDAALSSMEQAMHAPSTMSFAQSRGAQAPDDLFSKVDADGSGGVSSAQLQSLMSDMSGKTVSEDDAKAMFAALDSDADGSLSQAEFEAARPQNAGGMPPSGPPPAGAADSTQASAETEDASGAAPVGGAGGGSTTTVYDALDTNEDGEVSLEERLAGAQKAAEAQAKLSGGYASTASASRSADQDWARQALSKTVNAAYSAASGQEKAATSTFSYAA